MFVPYFKTVSGQTYAKPDQLIEAFNLYVQNNYSTDIKDILSVFPTPYNDDLGLLSMPKVDDTGFNDKLFIEQMDKLVIWNENMTAITKKVGKITDGAGTGTKKKGSVSASPKAKASVSAPLKAAAPLPSPVSVPLKSPASLPTPKDQAIEIVNRIYTIRTVSTNDLFDKMGMIADIIDSKYPDYVYTDLPKLLKITKEIYDYTDTRYQDYDSTVELGDGVLAYIQILFSYSVDRIKIKGNRSEHFVYYVKYLTTYHIDRLQFFNTTLQKNNKNELNSLYKDSSFDIDEVNLEGLTNYFYKCMYTHYHRYADGTDAIDGIDLKSIPRGLRYIYDIMFNAYRLYYTYDNEYLENIDDDLKVKNPETPRFSINPQPKEFYVVNTLDRTEKEQRYIIEGIKKSRNIYFEYVKAYSVSSLTNVDVASFFVIEPTKDIISTNLPIKVYKDNVTVKFTTIIIPSDIMLNLPSDLDKALVSCLVSDLKLETKYTIHDLNYHILTPLKSEDDDIMTIAKKYLTNNKEAMTRSQKALINDAKKWPLFFSDRTEDGNYTDGGLSELKKTFIEKKLLPEAPPLDLQVLFYTFYAYFKGINPKDLRIALIEIVAEAGQDEAKKDEAKKDKITSIKIHGKELLPVTEQYGGLPQLTYDDKKDTFISIKHEGLESTITFNYKGFAVGNNDILKETAFANVLKAYTNSEQTATPVVNKEPHGPVKPEWTFTTIIAILFVLMAVGAVGAGGVVWFNNRQLMSSNETSSSAPPAGVSPNSTTLVTATTGNVNLDIPPEVLSTLETYPTIIHDVLKSVQGREMKPSTGSGISEVDKASASSPPIPSINTPSIGLPPAGVSTVTLPTKSKISSHVSGPRGYGLVKVSSDEYEKINTSLRYVLKNVPMNQQRNLIQNVNYMLVMDPSVTSSLLQEFLVSTNYRLVLEQSLVTGNKLQLTDFTEDKADAVSKWNTNIKTNKDIYDTKLRLDSTPFKKDNKINQEFKAINKNLVSLVSKTYPDTTLSEHNDDIWSILGVDFQRVSSISVVDGILNLLGFNGDSGKRKRGSPDIMDPKFSEWREEQFAYYIDELELDKEENSRNARKKTFDTPGESCYKSSLEKIKDFVITYGPYIAGGIIAGGTVAAYCLSIGDISALKTTLEFCSNYIENPPIPESLDITLQKLILTKSQEEASKFDPLYHTATKIIQSIPVSETCTTVGKFFMTCINSDGGECSFHKYVTDGGQRRNQRVVRHREAQVVKSNRSRHGAQVTKTKRSRHGAQVTKTNRSRHGTQVTKSNRSRTKPRDVLHGILRSIKKESLTGGKRSNKQRRIVKSKGKRRSPDGGNLLMVNTPVIPYNTCKVWK